MKEKTTRRLHNMYISGICIILLGFWTVIKTYMGVFFAQDDLFNLEDYVTDDVDISLAVHILFIMLAILCLFIFLWHLYIGSNSMRIARGKKHGRLFIPFTIMFLILTIISFASYGSQFDSDTNLDTVIVSIFVDISMVMLLADILISFFVLKKQDSKIKQ